MPVDLTAKNEHVDYNTEKRKKMNLQYFVAADVACPMLATLTGDPPG